MSELDFDEMEMPVPCPCCKEWVELNDTLPCDECDTLVCPSCLNDGLCKYCRNEP
jgi:hypothetical protein